MSITDDIASLSPDQIEDIEKLTMRWLFQAVLDFGMEAHGVFRKSPDDVKDVAEDITREMLDRLPGFNVPQRIYGTVDYKRARYVILPAAIVRQALFVDSKAEKAYRTATIQMSQTSLRIRHIRAGFDVDVPGLLPAISLHNDKQYLTTTAFIHFGYQDNNDNHDLQQVTIMCLPNGRLQDRYNPDVHDTIWLAGRNAPTLDEDFRVRLAFAKLEIKARWRVQRIKYASNVCQGIWSD